MSSLISSALLKDTRLKDKYAVGEVADFAGVPSYYQASDGSEWLDSMNWTAAELLSSAAKALLCTDATKIALSPDPNLPPAAKPVSATLKPAQIGSVAIPSFGSDGVALVLSQSGAQLVQTGLSSGVVSTLTDGTNFYAVRHSGTALAASDLKKGSADGLTWSTPVGSFSAPVGFTVGAVSYELPNNYSILGSSMQNFCGRSARYLHVPTQYNTGGFFWLGARFLALGADASSCKALTSTDFLSWADNSSTVLGSTSLTSAPYHLHRNGQKSFVVAGATAKFSTDGGVSFAASTGAVSALSSLNLQENTTNKDKVVLSRTDANATDSFVVSTNCGASFTSCIPQLTALSYSGASAGTAYKDSKILTGSVGTTQLLKSDDDGATFSKIATPVAAQGTVAAITADETNFYIWMTSNQVVVSPDLVTFLVRTLPSAFSPLISVGLSGALVALSAGILLFSTDGGVNWTKATATPKANNSNLVTAKTLTLGSSTYLLLGSSYIAPESALLKTTDLEGRWFRASTAAIPAARTGMTAKVRVS